MVDSVVDLPNSPNIRVPAIRGLDGSFQDVMAGRPLELEALNGAVVRAGNTGGIPTPTNNVIYAMLKPLAGGMG